MYLEEIHTDTRITCKLHTERDSSDVLPTVTPSFVYFSVSESTCVNVLLKGINKKQVGRSGNVLDEMLTVRAARCRLSHCVMF